MNYEFYAILLFSKEVIFATTYLLSELLYF
jgi:hypothetical protein